MKRTLVILLLIGAIAVTVFTAVEAGQKKDNRPNGGSPMAAIVPIPINSTVTGRTFTTPGPMTRNSSEWKV